VQNAVNLGWKLAQVVNGTSPEHLLDTYHADERHRALRDTMTELLAMDEPRRRIAAMLSGLDIHYDLDDGHPLLGRRMPDLDLHTAEGPSRVFAFLHEARPVLLNLGGPAGSTSHPGPADDAPEPGGAVRRRW
jgi:hypothetical protein